MFELDESHIGKKVCSPSYSIDWLIPLSFNSRGMDEQIIKRKGELPIYYAHNDSTFTFSGGMLTWELYKAPRTPSPELEAFKAKVIRIINELNKSFVDIAEETEK